MKKLIIPIISVVVLLSILAVAIFALNSKENAEAKKPSAFETLSKVAVSENGMYSVSKLNQREIFSDFSSENISHIMAAFDVVISKNDVIELAKEPLICCLFNDNEISYQVDGDKILVNTDVDANLLKYAMYASVYIVNFPETVFRISDPRLNRNAFLGTDIEISFDYDKYGYKDAFEYLTSDAKRGDKTFRLCGDSPDMYLIKSNSLQEPAPNLLSCICLGDSIRIQRHKGTYVPKVDYTEGEAAF